MLKTKTIGQVQMVPISDAMSSEAAMVLSADQTSASAAGILVPVHTESRREQLLEKKVLKLQTRLGKVRKASKIMAQRLRRSEAKNAKLEKDMSLVKAKQHSNSEFAIVRPKTKHLSPQSTIAIGIRRNLGYASASDFANILLEDISRFTILRAEVKVALKRDRESFLEVFFLVSPAAMHNKLINFRKS